MTRSILFWIIILILWLIFGTWLCNRYICGANISAAAPAAAAAVAETNTESIKTTVVESSANILRNWTYRDGNLRINTPSHFGFKNSSFTPIAGTTGFNTSIQQTADYLKNNAGRSLLITGYYKSDENNNSILDNLGLARANNVKNMLSGMGVPSSQLDIEGRLLPKAFWSRNDTIVKGIDFSFSEKSTGPNDRITGIRNRLVGKPLTLYFGTNQDQISLNAQQRKDFGDMIYYLDKVNGSKLNIGGHTDNTGNRDYNVNLSKQRADFVKTYIRDNGGINNTRMNTNGFGPDNPVQDNATPAGRSKNRRVEVTLR